MQEGTKYHYLCLNQANFGHFSLKTKKFIDNDWKVILNEIRSVPNDVVYTCIAVTNCLKIFQELHFAHFRNFHEAVERRHAGPGTVKFRVELELGPARHGGVSTERESARMAVCLSLISRFFLNSEMEQHPNFEL